MSEQITSPDDEFELFDLSIIVETIDGNCTCNMNVGDVFYLRSNKISIPTDFCLYALQSVIPLLPAKQRQTHSADWITTDSRVTCPDPACRLIMRIERNASRKLRHSEVSVTPMPLHKTAG